jgi:hypothetical protein
VLNITFNLQKFSAAINSPPLLRDGLKINVKGTLKTFVRVLIDKREAILFLIFCLVSLRKLSSSAKLLFCCSAKEITEEFNLTGLIGLAEDFWHVLLRKIF